MTSAGGAPGERPAGRFPAGPVALIGLALLAATLPAAGRRDLWAPDEPKYALAAREMLEGGDWLIPRVNGTPYPDKPPLLIWLIALLGRLLGGVGQPAAVLPSLLAAPLAVAAAARLAFRLDPERRRGPPLLAAGLLATTYQFVSQATVGQTDMLLCATTAWGFALAVEGLGLFDAPPRPVRLLAAFSLFGVATLTKGPVGLIVPVAALAAGAIVTGQAGRLAPLSRPGPWAAWGAVVLAWLLPAATRALALGPEGRAWLADLLVRQTVVRYFAPWHHHRPLWYLPAALLYDLLPAILLAPAALVALRRGTGGTRRARLALAAGTLAILVFFSLSPGKRDIYLLPAYPLLAAWFALDLDRRLGLRGRALRPVRIAAWAAALLFGAVAMALALPADAIARLGLARPAGALAVFAGLAAFGCAAVALGPGRRVLAGALAALLLFYGAAIALLLPPLDETRSARRLIERVRAAVQPAAEGGMIDFRAQFGFYYGGRMASAAPGDAAAIARLARRLAGDDPFWVLARRSHLPALRAALPSGASMAIVVAHGTGPDDYVAVANRAALAGGAR